MIGERVLCWHSAHCVKTGHTTPAWPASGAGKQVHRHRGQDEGDPGGVSLSIVGRRGNCPATSLLSKFVWTVNHSTSLSLSLCQTKCYSRPLTQSTKRQLYHVYSQSSGHLDSLHNSQGSGDKQEITESSQRLKTNIINSVGGDSVFSLPFYSIKKWLILRWLCPKLYISGVTPQSSLILEECQQFMSKQDELQISETPPEGIKDNHRYQMTVKVFYMNSLNVWGPSIENPNYM